MEPLSQQAETAKKFTELQSRLWDIEIGLLIRDLKRFTDTLEQTRQAKLGAAEKLDECDKHFADLESGKDKQSSSLSVLEEEVENARRIQQTLAANLQRLESKAALIDERLKSAKTSRNQADDEISVLERKIEEMLERIREVESEERTCSQAEARARGEVEGKSVSLDLLNKRFEEASRSVNDQKASYLELAKELAAKRNALQNSTQRVAQLEAALGKFGQELDALQSQKLDIESQSAKAAQEVETLQASLQDTASEIARLLSERKRAEEEVSSHAAKDAEVLREITARSSRLITLREMAEAHEGFFEGVRNVMSARKALKIMGEFAVVADVISVPKGYETAVEIALGASLQDVITDSVSQAKEAIAFLKANRAGRATFLPLDNMRPSGSDVRGKIDPSAGALGIAADLVGYDSKYDPAIRSLLGRVIVADNVDDAVALSTALSGWSKIVTLDGELITPSGAMTGGTMKSRGSGLLLRKQEIDSLSRDIRELEKTSSDLQARLSALEMVAAECRTNIASSEKLLGERRMALADQQSRIDFASKEAGRISRQIETVSLEAGEAETLRNEEAESVRLLQEELRAAGEENTDLDRKVIGAEQSIEELQKRRDLEREGLMQLNVELAGCVERTSALKRALQEAKTNLNEMTAALNARHSQIDAFTVDMTALLEERNNIEQECANQRGLSSAADGRLNELIEKRTAEQRKLAGIDSQLREVGSLRNQLALESHEAEVKEARLEVQVNQACDRLLQEYELTYQQAMAWPEEEVEVERGAAAEVARLRREIKEMGSVNTGAMQEYERIKERWDFLTEQRTDLEGAKDQINDAIKRSTTTHAGCSLKHSMPWLQTSTKCSSSCSAEEKTELTLTDPNNLLETGLDVTVQPPGKKLQDMALLSGGEKGVSHGHGADFLTASGEAESVCGNG